MTTETALGWFFHVEIDDGRSLGAWTKCEGLSVEWDLHEYKEGGVNDYIHRLHGRTKYQNLKLTRPVTAATADVISWLREVSPTQDWPDAKVSVCDAAGEVVATWTFGQVRPVKWQGPVLDVGQNQVAIETLELAHNGFLGQS
jgi:phage tail-like protein